MASCQDMKSKCMIWSEAGTVQKGSTYHQAVNINIGRLQDVLALHIGVAVRGR